MVNIRKMVLVLTASSILSSNIHALTIGEIRVNSTLHQPFSAEIELYDLQGLGELEIMPFLAPPESFRRFNILMDPYLNTLNFKTNINRSGRSYIKVSSDVPFNEPYLKFLVNVSWPQGNISREFSALIDPPRYSNDVLRNSTQVYTSSSSSNSLDQIQSYRVKKGDNLNSIIKNTLPGVNKYKALIAIQKANPRAFINNNINMIKTGVLLEIPIIKEINSVKNAVQNVRAQNASWRDLTQQINATEISVATNKVTEISNKFQVVGSEGGQLNSSTDSDDITKELQNRLAIAYEERDTAIRELAELKIAVENLSNQISKYQSIIELSGGITPSSVPYEEDGNGHEAQREIEQSVENRQDTQDFIPQSPPQVIEESLFSNPLFLVGVVLSGLAGGFLFIKYKKRKEEDGEYEEEYEGEDDLDNKSNKKKTL